MCDPDCQRRHEKKTLAPFFIMNMEPSGRRPVTATGGDRILMRNARRKAIPPRTVGI